MGVVDNSRGCAAGPLGSRRHLPRSGGWLPSWTHAHTDTHTDAYTHAYAHAYAHAPARAHAERPISSGTDDGATSSIPHFRRRSA
jgi:hypothetical protein